MKKTFKKIISIICAVLIVVSANAYAVEEESTELNDETINQIIEQDGTLELSAKQYAKFLKRSLKNRKFVENELMVIIKDNRFDEFNSNWKDNKEVTDIEEIWGEIGIYKIALKKSGRNHIVKMMDKISHDENVKFVEPNFLQEFCSVPKSYNYQNSITTAFEQIEAPRGWDFVGSNTVKVGVIDTGINEVTVSGKKIIDVNENLSGNYVETSTIGDCNVRGCSGHGTGVAGIIAANPDGTGDSLCGIGRNVNLISYKIGKHEGTQDSMVGIGRIIQVFDKAKTDGVKVLNCSYGVTQTQEGMEEFPFIMENTNIELTAIKNFNGLVVKSAGNSGHNDDTNSDKADYKNVPNLIIVGATDRHDNLGKEWPDGDSSDYGTQTVHIAAPGTALTVYASNGEKITGSGTSIAAPMVAATAELIYTINPNFTPAQVKSFILNNADIVPQLEGKIQGGRRLNVRKAMQAASSKPEKHRIAYVNNNNELYMKQNGLGNGWSCLAAGVTDFCLDGNNVATLYNDSNRTVRVKKNTINGGWESMGNGCKSMKLKGSYVAMLKDNGDLVIKNVNTYTVVRTINNVKFFDLDNNRVIYVTPEKYLYYIDDIDSGYAVCISDEVGEWAWCKNGRIQYYEGDSVYAFFVYGDYGMAINNAVKNEASITLNRAAYISNSGSKMLCLYDQGGNDYGKTYEISAHIKSVKLDRYNIFAVKEGGEIVAKSGAHNAPWVSYGTKPWAILADSELNGYLKDNAVLYMKLGSISSAWSAQASGVRSAKILS